MMEKAKRDSSRPRPEELTEKEARRVRPRVWKGQGKFLSTDEEQLIPPCYRFPSSFLRFPSPFCLQTSWCSWMRKENKKHAVALLYPLRTRAQKKNRANKLKARDGEERISQLVTSSWVMIVFDLLFVSSFSVLVQESNGTDSFSSSAFHSPSICTGWQETLYKVQRGGREWERASESSPDDLAFQWPCLPCTCYSNMSGELSCWHTSSRPATPHVFYLWFIVFVRTGAILLKQCYLTQVCKRPSNS